MPEKNVREMSKIERMHYSLASRTFHTTIIGAIILGTITLLIGLGLYAYAIFSQTVGQGYGLAQNVNAIVSKVVDITTIEDETMEIYNSYSKEELDSMSHEEYSALFSHIANSDESQQLVSVIADFRDSSEIDDIFYVTFDKENQRMIFLSSYNVGGQGYSIGDYYPVDDKFIDKFTSWNGEGKLYQLSNIKGMGVTCLCGVPVKDAYGTTKGFVLTYLTLNNFVSRMNSFFIQFSATMFVLVNAVAIIFSLYMKKKLVKPINQIAEAAEHYVTDRRQGNKATNHFSSLNIRTGDEIENLAMIMDDMEKDLVDFEENLTQVTKEKERIGTELALATRIQADMLPNIYPAFPERKEFDIFASMNPAKEVGGDFYDFFLIDDHRLGLVIADVSGKGVPAA